MDEIKAALNTQSRMTVFRRLRKLDYIYSCSHREKYYSLKQIAKYSEYGLWIHKSVLFSKHGTLKNTLQILLDQSFKGDTASEFNEILKIKIDMHNYGRYNNYIKRRYTMQSIQEYVPVTKAKTNLLEMVRKIKDSDDAIAITKNGIPEVVLISMDRFDGLLETLEILSDEKAMKSIRKSIKEADKGMWLDYDEVFTE